MNYAEHLQARQDVTSRYGSIKSGGWASAVRGLDIDYNQPDPRHFFAFSLTTVVAAATYQSSPVWLLNQSPKEHRLFPIRWPDSMARALWSDVAKRQTTEANPEHAGREASTMR